MKAIIKLFRILEPPIHWKVLITILSGIFAGILLLLVHISRATSYLSDNPKTCINCHVMYPQYASWTKGSHGMRATCTDCHVPHDNIFRKYYFKGSDGLRHATWFTMRWEPQTIVLKHAGIGVVQENCIRCHRDLVDMTSLVKTTGEMGINQEARLCWDCHEETPHGSVRSLSAAPNALVERLPSAMPEWLNTFIKTSEEENR